MDDALVTRSNSQAIREGIERRIGQGWSISDSIEEASVTLGITKAMALMCWLFGSGNSAAIA